MYRVDSDEEVIDDIIFKATQEILTNIRYLQDYTYTCIRYYGYNNNEISNIISSSYMKAINLIVENTNFKGIKLLDGTYGDIPNLGTEYLGLDNTALIFDMSSKESVALTRRHLEYAVNKLKNYTEEEFKYTNDIILLESEHHAATDAFSLTMTIEGALAETADILQRMKSLQIQKMHLPDNENDLINLITEEGTLLQEIDKIANNANFYTMGNKIYPLNGSQESIVFEFGRREEVIELYDARLTALGLNDFFDKSNEEQLNRIDNAIKIVSNIRIKVGALQNSYDYIRNNSSELVYALSEYSDEEEMKEFFIYPTLSNMLDRLNRMSYLLDYGKDAYTRDDIEYIEALTIEANEIIRVIDIMVEDTQLNGTKLLDGTYNNIPSLYTSTLGYNNTKLIFDVSTESNIAETEQSINYAIDKVKSILSN